MKKTARTGSDVRSIYATMRAVANATLAHTQEPRVSDIYQEYGQLEKKEKAEL